MHRAESIMQAITTNVTGLTTTGANVYRGRAYPVAALPALSVSQGAQQRLDDYETMPTIARTLDVDITAHVQQVANTETTLNQIETEIYSSLKSSANLGLPYVLDIEWRSSAAPDQDGKSSEVPIASMVITFEVRYEHSDSSTES
jgi:hypothetical protein